MPASIRLTVALLALLLPALAGCGSDQAEEASDAVPPAARKAYVRELRAAAPPENSPVTRTLNEATEAGEYRRAAVAMEEVVPELRAFVRRLEEVDPPPACARFHRQLERVQRATIDVFAGALPLYREDNEELVRSYMLNADRVLKPLVAPIAALDGSDRLPCLYE